MKINLFNFLHITPVFSIVCHKEHKSLEMMKVELVNTRDECKSLERLQIPCKKLKDAEDLRREESTYCVLNEAHHHCSSLMICPCGLQRRK